uniref:CDCA2 protein n=1 Tax=Sphenodon punctatus TaxID=8508 RepID=A0A8D0GPT3_SPHPU
GKPLASLRKFRRRSAIGARGSPENNALIKYIAHQSKKRKEDPFIQQASPSLYRNVGSLRDKITAFQSSFQPMEEIKEKLCFPGPLHEGPSQTADLTKTMPFKRQQEPSKLSEVLTSECNCLAYG